MGIDFSHGDAHWSYGGFNSFRKKLAATIGIGLDRMIGFGGNESWDGLDDDIIPLLNHSDCDGYLTKTQCKKIAPRLRQLVTYWNDMDYDKVNALNLADGMDLAVEENRRFEFQ